MKDEFPTKEIQRKAGVSARKSIPKEAAIQMSRKICDRLAEHPAYEKAGIIFSYSPFGGEADVSFFNERVLRDGKLLALPVCHGEGMMVAAVPEGPDAMEIGKYGIVTPIEERCRILSPSELHMVIVPCTAFEGLTRMRIGMGAGYYDRYLPKCVNAVRIAAAYEAQHINGLCVDEWDVPLDAIVTETNRY